MERELRQRQPPDLKDQYSHSLSQVFFGFSELLWDVHEQNHLLVLVFPQYWEITETEEVTCVQFLVADMVTFNVCIGICSVEFSDVLSGVARSLCAPD